MSGYSREAIEALLKKKETWTVTELREALNRMPERPVPFTTLSDVPVDRLYGPWNQASSDYERDLGFPGQFPYTRGIHPSGYRGKNWTTRIFSGFGTASQTNERYHYLLKNGQMGLSVAFHLPTLMGLDSDDPRSAGEVGKCGVAMDSLRDMETLFSGIPMGDITTSMTTNAPAAIVFSFFLAAAEKQGVPWTKLGGTTQNDVLKEFIAQKTWIFPPRPAMRLVTDMITFCREAVPKWNTISISGYHIREAGSTAAQELAFTLYDGLEYVRHCVEAGLDVDSFAPRLSFFFNSHSDFFEEIAKMRAARRMWAKIMKERFGAKDVRSMQLRFHTQTAGCSLTAQQPYNNIVRTALQALAGVLGGTQSLHTNSMDETLGLPTEQAVTIALRTQQIIAEETGVTNTIDPLGGSWFVETLTDEMESQAWAYVERLDSMGGMIPAIEKGYTQQEIHKAALRYHEQVEKGEKTIVGVTKYVQHDEKCPIEILDIPETIEREQVESLRDLRQARDNNAVQTTLKRLKKVCEGNQNVMPPILDCVRSYATLGEIVGTMKEVFGEYRDPGYY
ncbi:MAG: methylmalonyl-CoA mutase family protein [Deltaproteobacteria bacterium]|nr:methylmalonyl-CoA mutase family protein [Deltaproteobacteria bacterium]